MLSMFAIVSGMGWAIDFSVFYGLCTIGLPVYLANMAGASLAVLFVFFASLRPIFAYAGARTSHKLAWYVAYQASAIPLASLAIGAVSTLGPGPLWAKILVTPLTFLCNYAFMRWLARNQPKAP